MPVADAAPPLRNLSIERMRELREVKDYLNVVALLMPARDPPPGRLTKRRTDPAVAGPPA